MQREKKKKLPPFTCISCKPELKLEGTTQDLILKCFICNQLCSGLNSTAASLNSTVPWFQTTWYHSPHPPFSPLFLSLRTISAFIKTISFVLMKALQPVSREYRISFTIVAFFPSEYHESCISPWCKVSDYINLSKLCWNGGHSICYNQ